MEQLGRFELLVGTDNIKKISNKKVLVIGLGGVGSYAVEALVRSGIGSLVLVDFDKIDITNLNRQLMTNHKNIGMLKTDVWKERIVEINPNCCVTLINKKITCDDVPSLLNNIDYVVDACDSVDVKKQLILECNRNGIKLISSMGTGNKFDPSRLKIMDIRKTTYDPLAKTIRKFVVDNKINGKVMVVCSDESPMKVSNPVGSTAFVPSTAGLLCASYVINDILKEVTI